MRQYFIALILGMFPALVHGAELSLIGRYAWSTEDVVGVSGIEILEDGSGYLAVSDDGWWLEGSFTRKNDVIIDHKLRRLEPIIAQNGLPVSARRVADWSDAEGLALAPDGRVWVSFERWAHVLEFDAPFTRARLIRDHPTFRTFADNWQLEAIAVDPEGRVFVFSEKPMIEGFPIYRLRNGREWVIDGYLPERDVFAIVGADFDEDGTLYLLERKLVVGLWWQNRVRRIRLDGSLDETIWTSERGEFDNMEGITLWRDAEGLRMTLVSDNNGSQNVPTEFVEFRVIE